MLKRTEDIKKHTHALLSYANPERWDTQQASNQQVAALGEQPLTRLWGRRWLIGLVLVLITALGLSYRIYWYECIGTVCVFIIGAAFIPRMGLSLNPQPVLPQNAVIALPVVNPDPGIGAIINALPDPALILSKDGNVLAFNSMCRDFLVSVKRGAHISAAIRNPKILDAVSACCQQLARQTVFFTERVPVERHMSATICYLSMSESGKDDRIFVCLRDLTEQLRHDQLRADFIANASHEIKTPLASLLGFIETLQGAARNDETARDRFLGIMAKQAERMARLIDNLMSLSRVEMRAHLKPQDQIHILDIIRHACDALEPMAAEADIEVNVASEIEDAIVLGDRDELTQVFINLLHNAIKYGRPGGKVQISIKRQTERGASQINIIVEDDGPGIPAQFLPRLTERFYRVPETPSQEKGGTGLGLAIVKQVLNRHRAELSITSTEGEGSKFSVLLNELAL